MKPETRDRTILCAVVSGLVVCGVFLYDAAAHMNRSIETGQPRDLINRPLCWPYQGAVDLDWCAGIDQ
jgi:hypothetical protein